MARDLFNRIGMTLTTLARTEQDSIEGVCPRCIHRICGRCPGAIEAVEIHGGILGLSALPFIQDTDYGVCGGATLFNQAIAGAQSQ
jgi:hypothetical protein